jgi:hypothetical protein
MHGNINFVWNKIKDKEKFPLAFHKQLYIHGIFPSIDRKKTQINRNRKREQKGGLLVQIPPAAPFISMHPDNIRGRGRRLQRGDSSMDGEACLWRE